MLGEKKRFFAVARYEWNGRCGVMHSAKSLYWDCSPNGNYLDRKRRDHGWMTRSEIRNEQ